MNPSAPVIKLGRHLRRSKRLGLAVPVQVFGQDVFGESFCEFACMLSVSAHGGLLALAARVQRDHRILVVNRNTREEQEFRIVHVSPAQNGKWRVGIEFVHPPVNFWQIYFPPLISKGPLNARG